MDKANKKNWKFVGAFKEKERVWEKRMVEGWWWDWVMAGSDRAWGWVRLSESGRGEWGKWDGVAEWNERVRVGFISLYIYIYSF